VIRRLVKAALVRMPGSWRLALRRWRCGRAIRRGDFHGGEPEFDLLHRFVEPGDWVLDLGANIGAYTVRLSALVGPEGRVLSVEPVPETFAILTANALLAPHRNVTLLNLAASDDVAVVSMEVPSFESGLENIYQASVTTGDSGLRVVTAPVVSLVGKHRVTFVKIDVEGHEAFVLRGIAEILRRDHPAVVIECTSPEPHEILASLGYERQPDLPDSPNHVFLWKEGAGAST
jgi:FkbM family methyltransferase